MVTIGNLVPFRRQIAYGPGANDRKELGGQFFWTYVGVAGLSALLVGAIWYFRTTAYHKVLGDRPHSTILGTGGGISLVVTFVAFIALGWAWLELHNYLAEIVQGQAEHKDPRDREGFRLLEAIHDPPGDIFTLIGIGFTFVGLAVSLVTLPTEMIAKTFLPDGEGDPTIGSDLAAAAVVFGSSLAIGLIASLQGILFAVFGRAYAARYSRMVKGPSDISDDLHRLEALEKLDALAAMASDLAAIRALLTPSPPPNSPRGGARRKAKKP